MLRSAQCWDALNEPVSCTASLGADIKTPTGFTQRDTLRSENPLYTAPHGVKRRITDGYMGN